MSSQGFVLVALVIGIRNRYLDKYRDGKGITRFMKFGNKR